MGPHDPQPHEVLQVREKTTIQRNRRVATPHTRRLRAPGLQPQPGTGPLTEWAVEVVIPTLSLLFGAALLFLLFLF